MALIASESSGQSSDLSASFRVGALDCVALSDGYVPTPPLLLAPEVDAGELHTFLAEHGEDIADLRTPVTCLYVRMPDGRRLLIDAGMGGAGGHAGPNMATVGRLPEALREAGIDPGSIDAVLVSHIHPDHIGGLFDAEDRALCANATYYVPRQDADFWSGERPDLSGTLLPPPAHGVVVGTAQRFLRLASARTVLFDAGGPVIDGVGSMLLPGHTPGQVGFIIDGGADTLFYSADAAGHPAISVLRPEWRFAFDTDAALATDTRRSMVRFLAGKGWTVYTPHFPWPGVGRFGLDSDGAPRWTPIH